MSRGNCNFTQLWEGPWTEEARNDMNVFPNGRDDGLYMKLEIGYARVDALRLTYVGELGWELYVPADFAQGVYDRVVELGQEFGLKHCDLYDPTSPEGRFFSGSALFSTFFINKTF